MDTGDVAAGVQGQVTAVIALHSLVWTTNVTVGVMEFLRTLKTIRTSEKSHAHDVKCGR